MFNQQNDEIIDSVDFYLNAMVREHTLPGNSSQITVRIPDSLCDDLDILCRFLGGITRNGLINELLDAAVRKAIARVEDNPYTSGHQVNEQTISQAVYAARLARNESTK